MRSMSRNRMNRRRMLQAGAFGAGAVFAGQRFGAFAQGTPEAVSPSVFDPAVCYTPLGDSEMVQYDAVGDGPFNIALSNSYIGNVWRTQMIQMAQAFVQHDDIASQISEFQVNSSGTDDAAQIASIEDMISRGAQAIVVNANTPGGQVNVLEQARADGIVVVAFDNTIDSDNVVQVNEDQVEMGRQLAQFLVDETGEGVSGSLTTALVAIGAAFVASAAIGAGSYGISASTVRALTEEKLTTVAQERARELSALLLAMRDDLLVTAVSGTTVTSLGNLALGWDQIGSGQTTALQQAFIRHGAAQCGICTPAFLVAGTALLEKNPHPTEQEVEDALGGILCRCTGYEKILNALEKVIGPEAKPCCSSATED